MSIALASWCNASSSSVCTVAANGLITFVVAVQPLFVGLSVLLSWSVALLFDLTQLAEASLIAASFSLGLETRFAFIVGVRCMPMVLTPLAFIR